ncbi:SRPBCC domain-containing protein [Paenibacillus sp. GD4]|uniref:SRPBCC domain-containing protein n=1 Tax=Paenibacillus sp. GD4 TaxID=3068890 RepID=UPI002796D0D7|nr:SRPBCC domain-containing protein [Paenibacillus sp. GD4]MDQ1909952.1 SRPBCC domain-containing protein [Paenibacillus sp. GD4]
MPSSVFTNALREATGVSWEEWIIRLQRSVDPAWSHEQIKSYILSNHRVAEEWGEWLALLFGELLGRIPVGVTKDAGVQVGYRKTINIRKDQAWSYLTSLQGLALWLGTFSQFEWSKGFEFESQEGVTGKLTVVEPGLKLRMTYKRPEWETQSRLQLYFLATKTGKTTLAFHQEMLEDVYIRELMRRHWERVALHADSALEGAGHGNRP